MADEESSKATKVLVNKFQVKGEDGELGDYFNFGADSSNIIYTDANNKYTLAEICKHYLTYMRNATFLYEGIKKPANQKTGLWIHTGSDQSNQMGFPASFKFNGFSIYNGSTLIGTGENEIILQKSQVVPLKVYANLERVNNGDKEERRIDVTLDCSYDSSDPQCVGVISNNILAGDEPGESTITITYFLEKEHTTSFGVRYDGPPRPEKLVFWVDDGEPIEGDNISLNFDTPESTYTLHSKMVYDDEEGGDVPDSDSLITYTVSGDGVSIDE